jgi:hypothetical protein
MGPFFFTPFDSRQDRTLTEKIFSLGSNSTAAMTTTDAMPHTKIGTAMLSVLVIEGSTHLATIKSSFPSLDRTE